MISKVDWFVWQWQLNHLPAITVVKSALDYTTFSIDVKDYMQTWALKWTQTNLVCEFYDGKTGKIYSFMLKYVVYWRFLQFWNETAKKYCIRPHWHYLWVLERNSRLFTESWWIFTDKIRICRNDKMMFC